MNTDEIVVLIADDHLITGTGLRTALRSEPDIYTIPHIINDGQALLPAISEYQPHVLLLDVVMPNLDFFPTVAKIQAMPSAPKIIIITSRKSPTLVEECIKQKINGYLLKEEAQLESILPLVIRDVNKGKTWYSKKAQELTIQTNEYDFTDFEIRVLTLMLQAKDPVQISQMLGKSKDSIYKAQERIRKRLDKDTNMEVIVFAIKNNIISLSD